jgi:hypothetical protein
MILLDVKIEYHPEDENYIILEVTLNFINLKSKSKMIKMTDDTPKYPVTNFS